jgi:hypothetical protein
MATSSKRSPRASHQAPVEEGSLDQAFHGGTGRFVAVRWEIRTWITGEGVEVPNVMVGVDPATGLPLVLHETAAGEVRKAINRAAAAKYAALRS